MAKKKQAPSKENLGLFQDYDLFGDAGAGREERADMLSAIQAEISPAEAVEKPKDFRTIHQGVSTNALSKIGATDSNTTLDRISGEATIRDGNLIVSIPDYEQLSGLRTTAFQLLDAITIVLTETGAKSPTVLLTRDEFMKRRGLSDRKEAKKQAVADLTTLSRIRLSWEEKHNGEVETFKAVNLVDSVEVMRNGDIVFTFGSTFFNILKGYPVMPYPSQLQRLNSKRTPNSFYFLRKITELKNMNFGKKNEDIISVETLLRASPYMKSYAEVASGDRAVRRSIIDPFERDLDALDETLTWEYCHSLGEPLTDEEVETMSYEIFEGLLVKITWRNYPEQIQEAKLERRAEAIEKATKPKRKRASKKKKPAPETPES